MRVLVHVGDGRAEVQQRPLAAYDERGGRLAVEGSAACIADAETLYGHGPVMKPPLALGHEIVGRVAEVGTKAPPKLREMLGRRVAIDDNRPCGECDWCQEGNARFCRQPRYGHIVADGSDINWGGYASTLTLDGQSVLVPVDESLPIELATFVFPVGSGVEWLQIGADLQLGERVAVLGTSRMGLGTIVTAQHLGASDIGFYGAESGIDAIAAAGTLGVAYRGEPGVEHSNEPYDVVVVVTETPAPYLAIAAEMAGPLGRVIAASTSREPSGLEPETVRRKGLTIKGGRGASERALRIAADIVAARREKLGALLGAVHDIADGEKLLRSLMTADGAVRGAHSVIADLKEPYDGRG